MIHKIRVKGLFQKKDLMRRHWCKGNIKILLLSDLPAHSKECWELCTTSEFHDGSIAIRKNVQKRHAGIQVGKCFDSLPLRSTKRRPKPGLLQWLTGTSGKLRTRKEVQPYLNTIAMSSCQINHLSTRRISKTCWNWSLLASHLMEVPSQASNKCTKHSASSPSDLASKKMVTFINSSTLHSRYGSW